MDVFLDKSNDKGKKLREFWSAEFNAENVEVLTPVPAKTRLVMSSVFFCPWKSY